jgi:hypothetical protein
MNNKLTFMTDILTVLTAVIAVAAVLSLIIALLKLYDSRKGKKDRVIVTRFMEGTPLQWFVKVTPINNILEDCTVVFDKEQLQTAKLENSAAVQVGIGETFRFWAINQPSNLDEREIIVKNKGKPIYNRRFKDLNRD